MLAFRKPLPWRGTKSTLIFHSNAPRNRWKAPTHRVPVLEGQSSARLNSVSQRDLSKIVFTTSIDTQSTQVRAVGKNETEILFEALDADGRSWKGRYLLLTIGVES